jgi:hypothetical protein
MNSNLNQKDLKNSTINIHKIKIDKIYNKILKYLTKYFEENQFSHNIQFIDGIEHHSILSIKDKIIIELDDDTHFQGDNYTNILEKDIINIENAIALQYKVIRICLSDILQKKINLKGVIVFILNKIKKGETFNIYYVSTNKFLYKNHSLKLKSIFVSIMWY